MDTQEIIKSIMSLATIEIIFVIVVFRLILNNYKPPIQQSLQALVCVVIGISLAMVVERNVHSFMMGIIAAGIGFYGGTYINTIKGIKEDIDDENEKEIKEL